MFIAKVAGAVLFLSATLWAVVSLEDYTAKRYDHRFFSVRALASSMCVLIVLLIGYYLWQNARENGRDASNGMVLMVIGATVAFVLLMWNVRRAGFALGLLGTLLHIGIFAGVAYLGPIAWLTATIGMIFMIVASNAKPTDKGSNTNSNNNDDGLW